MNVNIICFITLQEKIKKMKDDVDEDDAGALSSTSVPETTISYG